MHTRAHAQNRRGPPLTGGVARDGKKEDGWRGEKKKKKKNFLNVGVLFLMSVSACGVVHFSRSLASTVDRWSAVIRAVVAELKIRVPNWLWLGTCS